MRVQTIIGSIMWSVVVLGCVLLSGCAGDSCPPPATAYRTIEVDKPIPVPCVKRSDIAAEPAHVGTQLTRRSGHDLLVVDQSALALRTWGEGMYSQLIACSTP